MWTRKHKKINWHLSLAHFFGRRSSQQGTRGLRAYTLACSCQEGGNLTDAVKLYLEAIALDPDHIDAHYNLATLVAMVAIVMIFF